MARKTANTELRTVDVDASSIRTATEFDESVRQPWLESGVLLLRKAERDNGEAGDAARALSPAKLVELSRFLGELDIHSAEHFLLPGQHEILQITNRKKIDGSHVGFAEAGRYWVRAYCMRVISSKAHPCRSRLPLWLLWARSTLI